MIRMDKQSKIYRYVSLFVVFLMVSVTWSGITDFSQADGGGDDEYHTDGNGDILFLEDLVTNSEGAVTGSSGTFVIHKDIFIEQSESGGETYFDQLIISSETTIKFDTGCSLIIEGALIAVGTSVESKDVIFTSNQATQNAGDWDHIKFESGCDYEHSSIEFCTIQYATDGLQLFSSSPNVQQNTIKDSSDNGIYADNSEIEIKNNEITDNGIGIKFENCPDNGKIESNIIKSNSNKGIYFDNSQSSIVNNEITQNEIGIYCFVSDNGIISNNQIYSNTMEGIYLENSNSEIFNNNIYSNDIGIYAQDSNPVIRTNEIYENNIGIKSYGGLDYPIERNNIIANNDIGISLDSSSPQIVENTITVEIKEFTDEFDDELLIGSSNNIVVRNGQVELKEQLGKPNDWGDTMDPGLIEFNPATGFTTGGIFMPINDHWENSGDDFYLEAQASPPPPPENQYAGVSVFKQLTTGKDDRLKIHFAGEVNGPASGLLGEQYSYEFGAETIFTVCGASADPTESTAKHIKYSTYNSVLETGLTNHEDFFYGYKATDNTYYFVSENPNYDIIKDVNIRRWFESYFGPIDWENYPTLMIEFRSREEYIGGLPQLDPKIFIDYILCGTPYEKFGTLTTNAIILPSNHKWEVLTVKKSEPHNTDLRVTITDGTNPITEFIDLDDSEIDLSDLNPNTYPSIKLQFDFISDGLSTPILEEYIIIYDKTNDISIKCVGSSPEIKDCLISDHNGNAFDLDISSNSHPILISTNYDMNRVTITDAYSDIKVKWYVNVQIVDIDNNPLPDINVMIDDKDGTEVFNGATNIEGYIEIGEEDINIICTEVVIGANSRTYETPHKVTTQNGNEINIVMHKNQELVLHDGDDSDLDLIPDALENNDNIIWFNPVDYIRFDEEQIVESGVTCPDNNDFVINYVFPLIDSGEYKLYVYGSKMSFNNNARMSITIEDSTSSLISNEEHLLSNNYRWYSTEMFTTSDQYITIKIKDVSPLEKSIYLSKMILVRFFDSNGISTEINMGQITNPLDEYSDFDDLLDGLELRDNTFWYEAEDFPAYTSTPIIDQTKACNSKAVSSVNSGSPETINIPVELNQGEKYLYYIRAKVREPVNSGALSFYDDFSDSMQFINNIKWEKTKNDGNSEVTGGYLIQTLLTAEEGFEIATTKQAFPSTVDWELYYKGHALGLGNHILIILSDGFESIMYEIPIDETPEDEEFSSYVPTTKYEIEIISDGVTVQFYRAEYGQTLVLENTYDISIFENLDQVKLSIGIYSEIDSAAKVYWNYVKVTESINTNIEPGKLQLKLGANNLGNVIEIGNKYQWYSREIDGTLIPSSGTYNLYATDTTTSLPGVYVDKIMISMESEILMDELSDGSTTRRINSENYDMDGNFIDTLKIHKNSVISEAKMKLEGGSTEISITPNNNNFQTRPRIWDDIIVWQDNRNGDWDLYIWDLSIDSDSDGIPNFLDPDDPDKSSAEIQITFGPADQINPAIWEDRIVWQDNRNNGGQGSTIFDIYMFDLDEDNNGQLDHREGILPEPNDESEYEISINNDGSNKINPGIWRDLIIWQDDNQGDWDIFIYDLSENTDMDEFPNYKDADRPDPDPAEKIITIDDTSAPNPAANQINPQIYEQRIVCQDDRNWDGNGNQKWDIYMYDVSFAADVHSDSVNAYNDLIEVGEFQITLSCSENHHHPDIYGEKIVYTDFNIHEIPYEPYYEWFEDIVIYNIGRSEVEKLIIGSVVNRLDIFGDKVVWDDQVGEVSGYDISSDIYMNQIIAGGSNEIYPAVHRDHIVWQDQRMDANGDIYLLYQNYNLNICNDGTIEWCHSELFLKPESMNDFSDELNDYIAANQELADANGYIDVPLRFHSDTSEPLTVSDINIRIEFLTDPLSGDTDGDTIPDNVEIQGYFGYEIVEFEDVVDFREWKDPKLDMLSPYYPTEKLYTTNLVNFIHQTGVTLTTSKGYIFDNGPTRDSWVSLKFHSDYTNKYELIIEPKQLPDYMYYTFGASLEDLRVSHVPEIVETYYVYVSPEFDDGNNDGRYPIRVNDRLGGYSVYSASGQGNYLFEDWTEVGEYFNKVISSATYIEIKRDGGHVIAPEADSIIENPIAATSVVKRDEDTNIPTGKGCIYGYYDYRATYEFIEDTDYSITMGIDYDRIPWELKPEFRYLSNDPNDPDYGEPTPGTEVPESLPEVFDKITLLRLIELDCIKIIKQTINPLDIDFDNDLLTDGYEADRGLYPLKSDPDHDGLNDFIELIEERTNSEYRDSDYDGIRDGVELGYSSSEISATFGDISSPGSWMERIAHWNDPFDFTPVNNFDADPNTITNPKNTDTDEDGLPDGWLDGWEYLSTASHWEPEYWRYDPLYWGFNGEIDNIVQVYEGEDLNLDGSNAGSISTWEFDPYTKERLFGTGETKPNYGEFDTDSDQMPDGYEVWYSTIDPIKDDSGNYFLDPITDDGDKDSEPNDAVMSGNTNSFGEYTIGQTAETVYSRAQKIVLGEGESYDDIIKIAVRLFIPDGTTEKPKMEIWYGEDHNSDGVTEPIKCLEIVETYTDFVYNDYNWYIYDIPDSTFEFNGAPSIPACYIVMSYIPIQDSFPDDGCQNYEWVGQENVGDPTGLSYRQIKVSGDYIWEEAECILNYQLYENEVYGDDLVNKYEYLFGTNPKSSNSDYSHGMVNDELSDGVEVGYDDGESEGSRSSTVPCPIGGIVFRSNVENGALGFDNNWGNPGDWIEIDGDGEESAIYAYKYEYSHMLINPLIECGVSIEGILDDIQKLFTFEDGSIMYLSADETKIFYWSPGVDIDRHRVEGQGTKLMPGKCLVFDNPNPINMDNYKPEFNYRNKYLPISNVYFSDSDYDTIPDGKEIDWNQNSEKPALNPDKLINCWDIDSDNDGIYDGIEINWDKDIDSFETPGKVWDPKNPFDDNDDDEGMVDEDQDGDGIIDGLEINWNKDTDGDGLVNCEDPDSDNDGLPDGYIDGYIWKPESNEFALFSGYLNQQAETSGSFDPWEGEDKDCNGIVTLDSNGDPIETNPLKKDSDGDRLYDGFDIYDESDAETHKGELYDSKFGTRDFGGIEQSGHSDALDSDSDDDSLEDGVDSLSRVNNFYKLCWR